MVGWVALGLGLLRKEEEPFDPSADQEFTPLVNSAASLEGGGSPTEIPLLTNELGRSERNSR